MNKKQRGKFIIIDGPDGVGKTSIVQNLKDRFSEDKVVFLRDPLRSNEFANDVGELVKKYGSSISADALALLSLSARTVLNEQIKYYTSRGINVITDRYTTTTLVYNADDDKSRTNILAIGRIMPSTYIEPDKIILLLYSDLTQSKKPEDGIEKRLPIEEVQFGYLNLIKIYGDKCIFKMVNHKKESCEVLCDKIYSDIVEILQ